MKHLTSLLLFLMFFWADSGAQLTNFSWLPQPDGSFLFHWDVPILERVPVEGGWVFRHSDATPILESGVPDLCQFSTSLLWETTAGWSWTLEEATFEDHSEVPVVPSRGNLYRNVDPALIPRVEGASYEGGGFWPASPLQLGDAFQWRGAWGQSMHLRPVAYRSSDQTVRVYSSITVRFTPNDGQIPRISAPTDPMFAELHARRFLNPPSQQRYDQLDEYGSILVLSPPDYFEALAPWIQWKREKGFIVDVVDVAEAGFTPAAIGQYVDEAYALSGYSYLVLAGDEDVIPSELVVNGGGAGYCDPCYGFIEGDDHYPELLVGRFLAHTAAELTSIIQRSLTYERNPLMDSDWFSHAVAIGSAEGAGFGDDGQSDWQHNNAIKAQLLDFTYTSIQELYDGNQGNSSPSGGSTADANGSPNPNHFANAVNDGVSLINYTGHGSHNSIATTGFTNNDMALLHNDGMWPYFIIVGCCVGDFDEATGSGDCFGEVWSKLEAGGDATGGIGGAFSSVLQSWAPPMEGQDEMNALIAAGGGVTTEHTLGGIHFHGCSGMVEAYGGAGEEMMDTWCLLGDPSLVLRTAMPQELTLSHETEVPLGVNALEVFCPVENALVAATVDGQLLARGWVSNGSLSLDFETPLAEPMELLITGTAFNCLPYQATVSVFPAEGPYVVDESVAWTDAVGAVALNNGNGIPESGELLALDIEVTNVGLDTAFNVVGSLSSDNPKVESVLGGLVEFGDLAPGESASVLEAYDALLAGVAFDDGELIWFDLLLEGDGGQMWTAGFSLEVHAPVWNWGTCLLDDEGDGWLQSGETAFAGISLTNVGGGAAMNASMELISVAGPLEVVGSSASESDAIAPGESIQLMAPIIVDDAVPQGSHVDWVWGIQAGPYSSTSEQCSAAVDLQVEDWEVSSTWPWSNASGTPWFETTANFFSGETSMQSGGILDGGLTTLSLEVSFANWGEISFARAVSSEVGFDFLHFKIDGQTQASWSGEEPWATESFVVFGGQHSLSWTYEKDELVSGGADAAWVDQIILPPNATVVGTEEMTLLQSQPVLYPNPSSDWVRCGVASERSAVEVLDVGGRVVWEGLFSRGEWRKWSVSGWTPGIYIVHMNDALPLKLIVQ